MKRFMKLLSGLLSLTVALTIVLSIPSSVRTYAAQGETFPDIKNHWGRASIEYATGKGIISGYPNGNYGPEDTITVEQFIILLVRTLGKQDVPLGLDNYIKAAQDLGILPIGEHYDYKAPILRGDMAKMAIRAYETLYPGIEYPELLDAFKGLVTDYDSISDILKSSVLKCVEQGILAGGDGGNFNENSTSTRAQAASVIHRLLSVAERERVKPVFAEPDYEFEAFMASEEAAEYFSTMRVFRIEDGVVYWDGRYGENMMGAGKYGITILPTFYYKESNKVVYETIRNMVYVARENGRYFHAMYMKDREFNKVKFEYFRSANFGRTNNNGADQFALDIELRPYQWPGQTKNSDYYVSVTHLKDGLDTDDSKRFDNDIVEAMEALIDCVYTPEYSEYIKGYILDEYNKAKDYSNGILDISTLEDKYIWDMGDYKYYVNGDLINYKEIEINNLGLPGVIFTSNR